MDRTWIITGVVALLIIGGAIVVSQYRKAAPSIPVAQTQTQNPAAEIIKNEPSPLQAKKIPAAQSVFHAGGGERPPLQLDHLAGTLKASVPVLTAREKRLPLDHSCFRNHISPPVKWEASPRETQSFAVFMERREKEAAPHLTWVLYNIPATFTGLPQNLPKVREPGDGMRHARSDDNAAEYVGPCEPKGKISYALRVFALDSMLALSAGAPPDDLIRAMNGHIIDMAEVDFIHYLRF